MGTVCLLGVCQCRSNLFTDTWACDSSKSQPSLQLQFTWPHTPSSIHMTQWYKVKYFNIHAAWFCKVASNYMHADQSCKMTLSFRRLQIKSQYLPWPPLESWQVRRRGVTKNVRHPMMSLWTRCNPQLVLFQQETARGENTLSYLSSWVIQQNLRRWKSEHAVHS